MRYAIVDTGNGLVLNVIEWDEDSSLNLSQGQTAINVNNAAVGPGWTYNGSSTNWLPPAVTPTPITVTRTFTKQFIVDKLQSLGKLEAARAALDLAPLYTREQWNNYASINPADSSVRALLEAIGVDPDAFFT